MPKPNSEVFADTAGWAVAFVRSEPQHTKASQLLSHWSRTGAKVVTTNLVLTELSALMTSPLRVPRAKQVDILLAIRKTDWVEIVHIDVARDNAAFEPFRTRPDKLWSLVDCASFIVMRERGITQALTSDHHFDQAGFARLLS